MSVIRVGTTKKFADNWEKIFGGRKTSTTGKPTRKSSKKSPKKKVIAKLAGKKPSSKRKARHKTK